MSRSLIVTDITYAKRETLKRKNCKPKVVLHNIKKCSNTISLAKGWLRPEQLCGNTVRHKIHPSLAKLKVFRKMDELPSRGKQFFFTIWIIDHDKCNEVAIFRSVWTDMENDLIPKSTETTQAKSQFQSRELVYKHIFAPDIPSQSR